MNTKLRMIQLTEEEINLLINAVQVYEGSDENSDGSESCENILQRLALILTNQ